MRTLVRNLLMLAAVLSISANALAYDFEVDGIYYNLISDAEKTVEFAGVVRDYPEENLNIPEKITVSDQSYAVISIGDGARENNASTTTIFIPKSVTKISTYALSGGAYGWQDLQEITVADSNPTYKSIDGVLYSKDGTALLLYPAAKNFSEIIHISNTVNRIGDYAFQGSSVSFIDLPNSVVEIGKYAFAYPSSSCSEIVIPSSVKVIGSSLVMESHSVESFTYKGSFEQWCEIEILGDLDLMQERGGYGLKHFIIGGEDMLNISSLEITESVTEIKDYTFANFWNLNSITFPSTLKSIGKGAFFKCPISDIIHIPGSVTYIGDDAFMEAKCSIVKMESSEPPVLDSQMDTDGITYCQPFPNDVKIFVPKGCKKQYETAGWNNTIEENKAEVTLSRDNRLFDELFAQKVTPNRVTDLIVHGTLNDDDWLWINSNMTSLYYIDASDTDCITIPEDAFNANKTLAQIIFPADLNYINDNAFNGCEALCGNIEFPNTLKAIGSKAFYGCKKITGLLSPNALAEIGDYAFANCSALFAVDMPDALEEVSNYTFAWCKSLKSVSLPAQVRTIGNNCFIGCDQLNDMEFPEFLESIGSYAFSDCQHFTSVNLSVCANLQQIGSRAFQGCSNIETLNLPGCQLSIGNEAFADCVSLKQISSLSKMPPTISANGNPFMNVDNMSCLLSIPTESFRDYFMLPYWAGFLAFEDKGEIQINVDGGNKNNSDYSIYYKRNDSATKEMKRTSTNNTEVEQEKFNAITTDMASVFAPSSSSVSFKIDIANGKKVKQLLYGGQDVTDQLNGTIYTTPIVFASDVKTLQIVITDHASVDGISENEAIKAYGENGNIMISRNSELETIEVYSVSGQLVYRGTDTTINVPAKGIYIVKVAGQTFKVAL